MHSQQPQQPGPYTPHTPPPAPRSWFARHKILTGIGALFVFFIAIGIASGEDNSTSSTDTSATAPKEEAAPANDKKEEPAEKPAAEEKSPAEAGPATLPNLVGMSLQDAQDTAQAAGFYGLTSHDATGMERFQALDRNWTVCSQEPAAGEHPTDTTVDFGSVKQSETCP